MPKSKPLSPAMQRLVRALEQYGHIDPIRDCGPHSGVNTLVALMDRGIIREAKRRHGPHFPATTPEQVWDEAHKEDERRADERAAHAECAEQWLSFTDDEGAEVHTRHIRGGGFIRVVATGHRHWNVYITDRRVSMSAAGTWQEARRAADNFERNQAHAAGCDEDDARSAAEGRESLGWGQPIAVGDTVVRIGEEGPDSPRGKVLEIETYSIGQQAQVSWSGLAPAGIALHRIRRANPIVEAVAGLSVCPAGHVAPKTDGDTCTDCEQPEGWGQPDGMLGATEAEISGAVTPPATCMRMDGEHATHGYARYGMGCLILVKAEPANAAALADVAALRELVMWAPERYHDEARERLARIEAALKSTTTKGS